MRPQVVARSTRCASAPLLVACLVGACGGGRQNSQQPGQKAAAATSSPQVPAFDLCSLLKKEEVEAAVGWKVAETKSSGPGDYGRCTYTGRTEPTIFPPEKVEVGIISCVTNMPCYEDLPDFRGSDDMARYRRQRYEGQQGGFEMKPNIAAVEGFGVPAIDHELAGLRSIEMQIGHKRVAFVSTWGESRPARDLARKVLGRVP